MQKLESLWLDWPIFNLKKKKRRKKKKRKKRRDWPIFIIIIKYCDYSSHIYMDNLTSLDDFG
jgi:hypothetical protein